MCGCRSGGTWSPVELQSQGACRDWSPGTPLIDGEDFQRSSEPASGRNNLNFSFFIFNIIFLYYSLVCSLEAALQKIYIFTVCGLTAPCSIKQDGSCGYLGLTAVEMLMNFCTNVTNLAHTAGIFWRKCCQVKIGNTSKKIWQNSHRTITCCTCSSHLFWLCSKCS